MNQPRTIAQAAEKKSENPLIGLAGGGGTYGSFDFGIVTFFAGDSVDEDDAAPVAPFPCGLLLSVVDMSTRYRLWFAIRMCSAEDRAIKRRRRPRSV